MTLYLREKLNIFTGLSTKTTLFLCALTLVLSTPSYAKEAPESLSQEALKTLARDFVARIGGKLKAHDQAAKAAKNAENPLSLIPDGEILLLRPRAEKFVMDREIAAVKRDGTIYYSLAELIDQLELSVDYSDEKKTGAGWFLREDWLVRFDFVKGEVVSRGKSFKVGPQDARDEDGYIYISQKAAKEWLDIQTDPDIAQQYLNIRTPYPFPALARNARERNSIEKGRRNQPVLPRLDVEEKMFDLTTAEIQQSMRVTKRQDAPTTVNHQNITTVQGDVLKHNLYASSFWDNRENLSSVRARLTKESEDPNLLGGLKARSYSIGDTDMSQLPLTGNSSQELGVRVNNNPLRNADFQDTVVAGDAIPGWDVELYRDGILIDRLRVDDTARYEFQDVQLFAGDNTFEVFFYGPQGEIRRDNFNLPVNEEFLATQDNTYDVSLTFSDAQVYTKTRSEDEDANTPHLVARYNKVIGNTLTYAGIRARQVDGEQKAYLGAGFTNVLGGVLLDGNAAADEKGSTAFELGARKNIDNWRLALGANARDEDYSSESEDENIKSVDGSITRNFQGPWNTVTSLNTNGLYGIRADDSTQTTGLLGLSNQIGRFNISNTVSYDKLDNLADGSDSEPRINDFLTARMSFGKFFTRAGVNYQVKPESKVESYFSQLSYQPHKKLGTDLYVEHRPENNYTEGRLSANYRHDKFRLSPFVQVDSNSEVQAGMKLTTSLIDVPQNTLPTLTGESVVGRGLVSSFVFHDKNGNNVFDGNDEPLPEVYVQSVNVSRRAKTDEKGYSLIKDLPESIVTDIRIDTNTLPDPFMIPGFAGVSIFPRAGQMVNLTFPIHNAGEIDGSVYIADNNTKKEVPGMTMSLIPVDGKSTEVISANTAGDGYYVLSTIPPGNYLLSINSNGAKKLDAGGAAPIPVTIGYDGNVISGKDFVLQKDRVQVPVSIEPYKGKEYTRPFFAMETGGSASQSTLSKLLSRLIEKKSNIRADEGLAPITMEGRNDLKILPGKDWAAHYDRCQLLNDQKIPCKIILFVPDKKDKKDTRVAQN